jgi:sphingolipid delta-4 desaturase
MGATVSRQPEFTWIQSDEPHATRRKLILDAHPEVKNLFGTEILTFPITVGIVLFQFAMAYYLQNASWGLILVCGYIFGGTANHSLQMSGHELSHNLCFKTIVFNKFLAVFANFPTGIPSAITFQKYHMEHHQFQGVDGVDADVPTMWEVKTFNNALKKMIWVLGQPFAYGLRPLFVKPKQPGAWETVNSVAQFTVDALVLYFWGTKALVYLVSGTFLGMGLHPVAGHFIAEHYEFVSGFETYSYYGPINWVNFNVGYHYEHHDFPKVPWSNLSKVRKIAPEFYDHLPFHTSYLKVFYDYIFDPRISPASRIKRAKPASLVEKEKRGAA